VNSRRGILALIWPIALFLVAALVYLAISNASSVSSRAQTEPVPSSRSSTPSKSTVAPSTQPTATAPAAGRDSAELAAVNTLAISNSFVPGYVRDLFGAGWKDPDRNGCDARNDVLGRDLTSPTFKPGTHDCVVLTGSLADPYSGQTISFVRGNVTSEAVQIDHIVPLGWAWQHGAATWTADQRLSFANDPVNLLAVDGHENESKSDDGPGEWLPTNAAYRCTYIVKFESTLVKYHFSVASSDLATIRQYLESC
jgi:hypothetical protein